MIQRTKPATLKQYGRAFRATSLSATTDAKIRSAIDNPQRPRRHWFPLVWATPFAAACAALALWAHLAADPHACEVTEQSDYTRYAGQCDVDLKTMAVQLSPGAVVEEHDSRVRLSHGSAHFSVHKVAPGQPPVTVTLPDATIEVLGTEFTVDVMHNVSRVHLHSGRVRFFHQGHAVDASRGAVDMVPGQLLTFESRTGKTELLTIDASAASDPSRRHDVRPAEPTSTPVDASSNPSSESSAEPEATSQPTPTSNEAKRPTQVTARSPAAANSAASNAPPANAPPSALDQALRLRAAGRYDEALAALDDVTPQGTRAREVVDYERAALTEHTSPGRACVRYRRHLVEFPESRYRAAVLQKLTQCNTSVDSRIPSPSE